MRDGRHATILLEPDDVRIPLGLRRLAGFRVWARSDTFPAKGRIDWIGGELEIDMSPEELNTHGAPKTAISRELARLVEDRDLGNVYIDAVRVSARAADLSAEPDVVVLLLASLRAGRVRLVAKARSQPGRYVEMEGGPDIVVECVSDSSEAKDQKRLLDPYFRAEVREYWLVDARGDVPEVVIHRRGPGRFVRVRPDRQGFVRSRVLGVSVRLVRHAMDAGLVRYRLLTR